MTAPPIWVDEELRDALDQIRDPHSRKKRTTVLRLAEAKATGGHVVDVFRSEDCCNMATWYGRSENDKNWPGKLGWKDLPCIANALEIATRRAHWYQDRLEEERLAMRGRVLAETQDRLIEISGAAVEVLLDVMLNADNDDVRRKAAGDALTHAAPETAPKHQSEQDIILTAGSGPSMRDIRNRARRLPDRVVAAELVEEAMQETEGVAPPPQGGLRIPQTTLYDPPPEITGSYRKLSEVTGSSGSSGSSGNNGDEEDDE